MVEQGVRRVVDVEVVAENLRAVKRKVGVPVYAVVKADAYGCGGAAVARGIEPVLAEGDGFYVFDLAEAVGMGLKRNVIALDQPWRGYGVADYLAAGVRPIVFSVQRAGEMKAARPLLSVDTGMRRFGIPPGEVNAALEAGDIQEVMTHAARLENVERLKAAVAEVGRPVKLHAAATALLDRPEAWLDAVRPGLAMYRGCMRVTADVVEVRDVGGIRAGYSHFEAERVGVILCGYSQGLRKGPCRVNGTFRKILEVGMQSAYIALQANEGCGTEVTLLGDGLTEAAVAAAWGTGEAEVLVRFGRM